jgi:hypothetical protein
MKTTLQNNAELTGYHKFAENKMIPKPLKKINWKKKADDAFSLLVRTEAGFKCQFHAKLIERGISAPCSCNDVVQCCHKITRGKSFIRYDRRNVLCGCSGSNSWSHWHEVEWNLLWKVLYPEDVEYLESIKNKEVHHKAWDYKIMIDEWKQQLEGLK